MYHWVPFLMCHQSSVLSSNPKDWLQIIVRKKAHLHFIGFEIVISQSIIVSHSSESPPLMMDVQCHSTYNYCWAQVLLSSITLCHKKRESTKWMIRCFSDTVGHTRSWWTSSVLCGAHYWLHLVLLIVQVSVRCNFKLYTVPCTIYKEWCAHKLVFHAFCWSLIILPVNIINTITVRPYKTKIEKNVTVSHSLWIQKQLLW